MVCTGSESWLWYITQTGMRQTQQSRTSCRYAKPTTSSATVSFLLKSKNVSATVLNPLSHTASCYAAQRKGILDLHGEQALKAGMAETQPGSLWPMLHITLFAYFQKGYEAADDSLCLISPLHCSRHRLDGVQL